MTYELFISSTLSLVLSWILLITGHMLRLANEI